jgi:hypothetical protein
MAKLARKNYKGIEFSEDFKMDQDEFNRKFGDCHIFKKLTPAEVKKKELEIAWLIAIDNPKKAEAPIKKAAAEASAVK